MEKDLKKAAYCFAQAAEQRLPRAQYLLGVCCEFGDGVEQDVSRALALYREAAGAGYPDAQCALGVLHHQGKGWTRTTGRPSGCSARRRRGAIPGPGTFWA